MKLFVAALLLAGGWGSSAHAGVLSFTGDLRTDANFSDCGRVGPSCSLSGLVTDADYAQYAAVVYTFTVTVPTPMQAITFSYGGGVNGQGTPIASLGFEPYLSLFDSAGGFLASTFFAVCPPGANTVGGNCYDVLLDGGILLPGDYQIGISAFENMSYVENGTGTTLEDGFTGLGVLGPGEDLHYAFDVVLSAQGPTTPEPGSFALAVPALLGIYLAMKRRTRPVREE